MSTSTCALALGTYSISCLLNGASRYNQIYMSSLTIASSIGCLHVQLPTPVISSGDTTLPQVLEKGASLSLQSLCGWRLDLSYMAGRSFIVAIA